MPVDQLPVVNRRGNKSRSTVSGSSPGQRHLHQWPFESMCTVGQHLVRFLWNAVLAWSQMTNCFWRSPDPIKSRLLKMLCFYFNWHWLQQNSAANYLKIIWLIPSWVQANLPLLQQPPLPWWGRITSAHVSSAELWLNPHPFGWLTTFSPSF